MVFSQLLRFGKELLFRKAIKNNPYSDCNLELIQIASIFSGEQGGCKPLGSGGTCVEHLARKLLIPFFPHPDRHLFVQEEWSCSLLPSPNCWITLLVQRDSQLLQRNVLNFVSFQMLSPGQ